MKRKFTRLVMLCMSMALLSLTIPSCKGKVSDADVKTAVESVLKANPDLQSLAVDVKDGVATLSGEVKDEATKAAAEAGLKEIKGLKSITNNITIAAPPAPAPVVTAPVISADDSLAKNIVDAIKDNPGVKADVKDGVVTLTGDIKKSDLPKLIQKVNALRPKKVDNKLTVK
ncbi:MAG: BON domain-containing protein [Bacteroidota bacterium]